MGRTISMSSDASEAYEAAKQSRAVAERARRPNQGVATAKTDERIINTAIEGRRRVIRLNPAA
jgi:hypothetical protein